jgi:HlyD family secretion protein
MTQPPRPLNARPLSSSTALPQSTTSQSTTALPRTASTSSASTEAPTGSASAVKRPAKQSSRPRRRWLWPVLVLLLVISAAVTVYLRQGSAAPAVLQGTSTATQGTVSVLVSGPGTLSARSSVPFPAPVSGTVLGLPAVGSVVKAGQVVGKVANTTNTQAVQDEQLGLQKAQAQLASLNSNQVSVAASRQSSVTTARLNVQDVQTTLSSARTTLASQTQLYGLGAISRSDLNTAQTAVQSAQDKLASAQATLNSAVQQASAGGAADSSAVREQQIALEQAKSALVQAQTTQASEVLRAPAAGVLTSVDAVNGGSVNAGTSLMTIADTSAMQLPVQVDETQIAQVKPGMVVRATLDALGGQTVQGLVTSVSPSATVSNNISVFTVNAELPNQGGQLKAGMSAQADIVVSEESGLVASSKAIEAVRTRSYVQVLPASTVRAAQDRADQTTSTANQGTAGQSAASSSALQVDAKGAATAVRTRVNVGLTDGTSTIITSGLQEGDTLLLPAVTPRSSTSSTGTGIGGTGISVGGAGTGGTRGGLGGGF